jgi:tRNA-dihydrouridine synthase B
MSFPSQLIIGNLKIEPPLALAPMVGLSHSALRSLLLEIGGVGLFYTEMLSARRLPEENEHISPCLIKSELESPLFYQVFLHDPSLVKPAVEKLHSIGVQGIDINLGCPAPKLRREGAGCALTRDLYSVKKIIAAFRKSTDLPLSVKIRLGEKADEGHYLDLCRLIEDEGADCLNIHARLNHEKFCRKPRWERVADAKKNAGIPIIANGGIFSVKDAVNCLTVSGADGLMIGRGAAVRPWVFSEIASALYGVVPGNTELLLRDVYQRFFELLKDRFSRERRLGRLKQFTHYFAESYPYGHQLSSAVQTSRSMEQAYERAERFFENNEPLTI